MTIRKTLVAIAAPFALAAAIGTTAVFAQSGDDTPAPSTDTPPATAPEKSYDGKDCPHHGGDSGSDTASLY